MQNVLLLRNVLPAQNAPIAPRARNARKTPTARSVKSVRPDAPAAPVADVAAASDRLPKPRRLRRLPKRRLASRSSNGRPNLPESLANARTATAGAAATVIADSRLVSRIAPARIVVLIAAKTVAPNAGRAIRTTAITALWASAATCRPSSPSRPRPVQRTSPKEGLRHAASLNASFGVQALDLFGTL